MIKAAPSTNGEAARHLPHVVAVASGKGGVGKSSIAVNLAIALARGEERVCILDADTGLANVNILLGLHPRLTLEHVLFGSKNIEEVMLEAPGGIQVIPGANGISECVTLQARQQLRLVRELARIEESFDYLIVDTAAGIAANTLDFIAASHTALIVITPEPTSLTDAFSLVKLMARRRRGLRYQVVVNMCGGINEGREVYQRFSAAVARYIGVETESLGFLPRDESLRNAVTLQHPVALFPDSDPSSRAFLRLADALRGSVDERQPRLAFSGYWQRHFQRQRQGSAPAAAPTGDAKGAPQPQESEFGAGLLAAIERGDVDPEQLAQLLRQAVAMFEKRYGRAPLALEAVAEPVAEPDAAPLAGVSLSERHVGSETHAGSVAPLFSTDTSQAQLRPDRQVAHPSPPAPADLSPALSPTEATRAVAAPAAPVGANVHNYDASRFGSQEALLARLRSLPLGDCSLAELLGQWRRTGY